MGSIVVTGAKGKLGRAVCTQLADGYEVVGIDADTIDICDYEALAGFMASHRPQTVINCAAWTDVDGCALDMAKALQINGVGAHNVALCAQAVGADVVQISSNEVFDGTAQAPYHEMAERRAINPYGVSKLYAERAIQQTVPRAYIVRTAWLFAHGGRNFIHAIRNAAEAGKALRVVTDEVANPTYNDDLALAIVRLIRTGRYGVYHLVNEGSASRYEFARYILDKTGLADTPITPIALKDWERPSSPPPYGVLANHAGASIGIRLRDWRDAVDAFLKAEGL